MQSLVGVRLAMEGLVARLHAPCQLITYFLRVTHFPYSQMINGQSSNSRTTHPNHPLGYSESNGSIIKKKIFLFKF